MKIAEESGLHLVTLSIEMPLSKIRVFLKTRPILTNTLVFVGLYAAGDISVQTFIYKNEKYDWKSTARYLLPYCMYLQIC